MATSSSPARSTEHEIKPSVVSEGTREHRNPSLYQINTRVWLNELSMVLRRRATPADIPDRKLDQLAQAGFDWLWFLGVWQTGLAGQRVSRESVEWQSEFRAILPDLQRDDVCGSCFAITNYAVHSEFGGNVALVHRA